MAAGVFRFQRFRTRLLVLMLGLLGLTQAVTYLIVTRANRTTAVTAINAALARGVQQFEAISARREADLLLAARLMAADYAMRQLFLIDEFSPATARSALESYQDRIQRLQMPVIVLLSPEGALLADTRGRTTPEQRSAFEVLRQRADESDLQEATGYGFLNGTFSQLVMVPLLAPPPEVVAWVGLAFSIDEATARELKQDSALEVSFLGGGAEPRLIASTLPPALAAQLLRAGPDSAAAGRALDLDGEPYLSTFRRLPTAGGEPVWIVLQRSLAAELAPARALENIILAVTLASLAAAALAALGMARGISRPVQQLAAHTAVIARGDYATRLQLDRTDELGQLAKGFNRMSEGLAERDRVRDLLDKNVSPAVAAQLMRDGSALGGEEREVTVLFADLRGFTTLSETLPPREVVALLNRYLDRMSAAIEAQGGVIDKFIGDEIMALFGAPVAQPDSADRALAAALAMRDALAALNTEFAAEGRPPLAFGIGLNTARVIAGNIGSHRRLNYSVIGDGVNIAARLQTLTRDPAHGTDIILSAATLQAAARPWSTRPLGTVVVKGRTGTLAIHALDGPIGRTRDFTHGG
ncbi:MAG: HAMP domain-containing protein [Opitutaceae bacterium]|nr:HAMP domain-containing protein [Opitutaceae bacterium]